MNGWQKYWHQLMVAIESSTSDTGQWRMIVALAILVVGLFLLELLFRNVRRRILSSLEQKGRDPAAWDISAVLPAVRLAATAWLLNLAESIMLISNQLGRILYTVQALLLAIAAITALFWLIGRLNYLRRALPEELQSRFPEDALARLKRLLQITVLIAAAAIFLYSQRSLNVIMLYWYHPPDWAAYMAFSERINLQIMRAFEAEGIEFAFPTLTNYLPQDQRRPLQISIAGESREEPKQNS
jgi:hypothetical protein